MTDAAAWAEEALGVEVLPWQRRALTRAAQLHHEGRARHPRPGERGSFNCQMVGGPMDGQTVHMATFEPVIRANVMPSQPVWLEDLGLADPPAAVPYLTGEYHFNYRLQAWVWNGTA